MDRFDYTKKDRSLVFNFLNRIHWDFKEISQSASITLYLCKELQEARELDRSFNSNSLWGALRDEEIIRLYLLSFIFTMI